jgi:DNA mismatch repair protein MutS
MEDGSLFYSTIKDATPVMSQYLTIKSQYPGCLLLFRMGDFFELFFEDAKVASSILNIALTRRGKHLDEDIPMCGIPVTNLDVYVGRLVKYGQKVAICDQVEDVQEAKKRGCKAIVKREVTRILTAGTIIEESLLNAHKNNFLMSIVPDICRKTNKIKIVSFAAIDISTGDFFVSTCLPDEFQSILKMYMPKEILIASSIEKSEFIESVSFICNATVTSLPDSKFNPIVEKNRLERYFKVNTLDSFGIRLNNELSSCGAVLEYLLITQRNNFSSLPIPKKTSFCDYLIIDPSTSKSLEITTSSHGEYEYSLLGAIDKTRTAFGARALAARVSMPLVNKDLLEKRLDCVEFFIKNEK